MNSFSDFNNLINYIEENLFSEINVETLSQMVKLSVYEFRRIFSFVVGTPLYEYIRKRRLSSCVKLIIDGEDLSVVSSKCGYDNFSSFSRAFKDFFGFAPSELNSNIDKLRVFTKAGLDVVIKGGNNIDYKIVKTEPFYIKGVAGSSAITDTECCESVWQKFDVSEFKKNNCGESNVYVAYFNENNSILCYIGKKTNLERNEGNAVFVPGSRWACFSCRGTDDRIVNGFYNDVLYNWLSSSGYKKNDKMPNLEVYPVDMNGDFVWEIYIPIL